MNELEAIQHSAMWHKKKQCYNTTRMATLTKFDSVLLLATLQYVRILIYIYCS